MSGRNTIQLALVREALTVVEKHATADDVYAYLAQRHPSISKSTVYRNLAKLAEDGEIARVGGLESAERYDQNTAPHYHFQCDECGAVFDMDMPFRHDMANNIRDMRGFLIKSHTITFRGVCPECGQ